MFYTSCGVADFWVTEVGSHFFGSTLGAPQVTSHVYHHLRFVAGAPPPNGVGLDVLIEQLVRIEIGAVAGQEEKTNLPSMAGQPSFYSDGFMDRVFVDDKKDFASSLPRKPL